jgi:hypothetical protein
MKTGFTHESTYNESKEWYTPPEIFEGLGLSFDLDPCYPADKEIPHLPVLNRFTHRENGLLLPWTGLVWLNPPYGMDTPRWLEKLSLHGNGVALVFSRTDTDWFHRYAATAGCICFMRGRVRFLDANMKRGGTPGCGSMLLGFGPTATGAIRKSNLGLVVTTREGEAGLFNTKEIP